MSNTFNDIYTYADSDAQDEVVSKFSKICDSLLSPQSMQNTVSATDLCNNQTLVEDMLRNCKNLPDMKGSIPDDQYQKFEESCDTVRSGELQEQCDIINKQNIEPDLANSQTSEICKNHKSGSIDDITFFSSFITSSLPKGAGEMQQANNTLTFLEKLYSIAIYLAIVCFVLLSLLYMNEYKVFLLDLGKILHHVGLIIIIPFLFLKTYLLFVDINTTFILESLLTGASSNLQLLVLKELFPIIFLKTFTTPLIIIGAVFVALGIISKLIGKRTKKDLSEIHPDLHKFYKK